MTCPRCAELERPLRELDVRAMWCLFWYAFAVSALCGPQR